MKKIILFLLFTFFLMSSNTYAFGWNKNDIGETKTHQRMWDDTFFDDPFFFYHKNFMNHWKDDLLDFSFSIISTPNNYPLDLEEQNNQLVATIDIPKFDPEEVEIEVKNDLWLIIRGSQEHTESQEDGDKKYYYRERSSGSFSRQILLPYPVDKSATRAHFKKGTLTIILPKKSTDSSISDSIPITIE